MALAGAVRTSQSALDAEDTGPAGVSTSSAASNSRQRTDDAPGGGRALLLSRRGTLPTRSSAWSGGTGSSSRLRR